MSLQPDPQSRGIFRGKTLKIGPMMLKALLIASIISSGLLATAAHAQGAGPVLADEHILATVTTSPPCAICDRQATIIAERSTAKALQSQPPRQTGTASAVALSQAPDLVCDACEGNIRRLTLAAQQPSSTYTLDPTATPAPNKTYIYLFWGDGCPHCEAAKPVLHEMAQRYPNVEIREYEVWYQAENHELFVKMAAAFGFEPHVVPTIFLGGNYWEGLSEQDKADMESLLAVCAQSGCPDAGSGVVPTPVLPEAQPGTAQPTVDVVAAPTQALPAPPAGMRDNGFVLAIAVMIGMAGTLVYTGVWVARGVRKDRPSPLSETVEKWRNVIFLVLCLIGLGVAGYLAYVEIRMVEATCGPVGDCNAVQASSYARLFGLLPVGVLGILGYLAILAVWGWSRLRHDRLAKLAPLAVFGMALLGTLFSLYLTYLEPFVIGAVCAWCITSAIIMTLLLLLSLDPTLRSLIGDTHD